MRPVERALSATAATALPFRHVKVIMIKAFQSDLKIGTRISIGFGVIALIMVATAA